MIVPPPAPGEKSDSVLLADHTTLRLGGPARSIVTVTSAAELVDVLREVDQPDPQLRRDARNTAAVTPPSCGPALIVGGGSNLVVADGPIDADLVKIGVGGVSIAPDGIVTIGAGVSWDDVVAETVAAGWCGIEQLSGIPGVAGTTPVQNVGAYGTEISELLIDADMVFRQGGPEEVVIHQSLRNAGASPVSDGDPVQRVPAAALGLGYRTSLLKHTDAAVITSIRLRLRRDASPVRYPQLASALGVAVGDTAPAPDIRAAVLALRRSKGMVLDPTDPDTTSAGSFFTNPIVTADVGERVRQVAARRLGADVSIPVYPAGRAGAVKLSAAWLIEKAGFGRGYPLADRPDARIALSTKHTLALTHRGGGTTAELLTLAGEIRTGVLAAFGVRLEAEPVLVGCALPG